MYDLIVVGGGPAGLTAAVYALRKRLNVLLVSKDLGGKTNYRLGLPWIDEYQVIRGLETVNKFKSELEYLDFARHMEAVDCVNKNPDGTFSVITRGGGELKAKAVIIATGAKQQLMHVPGEKEFMMKGLCFSALSYAPLFIEKEAVVVGDGELAIRSAAELATVAKKVTLLRTKADSPETPIFKKIKSLPNVTLLDGYQVVEVKGDEFARAMVVKDPLGKTSEIAFDGSFIEMALIPNTQMVADLADRDEQGRIKVDCANRTSVSGLFAAGDAATGFAEQVLIAVGDGAKAALSAYEYLLPTL